MPPRQFFLCRHDHNALHSAIVSVLVPADVHVCLEVRLWCYRRMRVVARGSCMKLKKCPISRASIAVCMPAASSKTSNCQDEARFHQSPSAAPEDIICESALSPRMLMLSARGVRRCMRMCARTASLRTNSAEESAFGQHY
jgi:hypothetical protein